MLRKPHGPGSSRRYLVLVLNGKSDFFLRVFLCCGCGARSVFCCGCGARSSCCCGCQGAVFLILMRVQRRVCFLLRVRERVISFLLRVRGRVIAGFSMFQYENLYFLCILIGEPLSSPYVKMKTSSCIDYENLYF